MDAQQKQRQWEQFSQRILSLLKSRYELSRLGSAGLRTLIDDYQHVLVDLARARSFGAPRSTVTLLNRLAVAGHHVLYGGHREAARARPAPWQAFARALRSSLMAFGLACAMLFVPALVAYLAVQWDPQIGYDLVPESFYHFNPANSENLHDIPSLARPLAASGIIGNNIQVSLMAFGLGLSAGIGTTLVLVYNGVHVGAVAGWMTHHGEARALWGWIMPHGGTEMLAICVAGAAGYVLAGAILMPGLSSRRARLKQVGRRALTLELGVMAMLLVAGIIEGFVSPSSLVYPGRIAVLVGSLCLWMAYFWGAGRGQSATLDPSEGG